MLSRRTPSSARSSGQSIEVDQKSFPSENNECCTCRQRNKKQRSSIICTGCSQRFCQPHHREHREIIEKDFSNLLEQHNVLRQCIYNENDGPNNTKLSILKKIDIWENDMIKNIQAVAAATKTRLIKILNEERNRLKNDFILVANELKANQSTNDYVETDLQQWQRQLNDCKKDFEQHLLSNDNFIDIHMTSLDAANSISVSRRNDVIIRTRRHNKPKILAEDIHLACKNCNKSFPKSSGYVEFCTADCSDRYNRNDSYEDDDDNNGGCFHGNCVVSMANGLTKSVKDIRQGDVLKTPDGTEATVTYVVKILCAQDRASMVSFDSGLIITPWHPVRINGNWAFPRDIRRAQEIKCEEVYNFVLDKYHIAIVNNIECVTLGHHFKGKVIEHPYYGTAKVVDDLRDIDSSHTGFIELLPNSTIRDKKTKLAAGIRKPNENFQMSVLVSC